MANDGQIVFEVTADGKHAIADIKDITKAIQNETKNWDKAAKESTDNISRNIILADLPSAWRHPRMTMDEESAAANGRKPAPSTEPGRNGNAEGRTLHSAVS